MNVTENGIRNITVVFNNQNQRQWHDKQMSWDAKHTNSEKLDKIVNQINKATWYSKAKDLDKYVTIRLHQVNVPVVHDKHMDSDHDVKKAHPNNHV